MNKEKWKPIKGFENLYEVSDKGRVRRIKYENAGNRAQHELPYYLKPRIDKDGYYRYALSKNNKYKYIGAHRLVAEAFIPNSNNYPCIDHIDACKSNNIKENLEWVTVLENNLRTIKRGNKNMKNNKSSKAILQYDLQGNFIKEWVGAAEIERQLGIPHSNIGRTCKGKYKQSHGYIWKFKESQETSTTIESTLANGSK